MNTATIYAYLRIKHGHACVPSSSKHRSAGFLFLVAPWLIYIAVCVELQAFAMLQKRLTGSPEEFERDTEEYNEHSSSLNTYIAIRWVCGGPHHYRLGLF